MNKQRKAVTFTLKVFPTAFMDDPADLEASDKILLPQLVFQKLMRHPNDVLPQPIIFQIESVKEFRKGQMHCGVLEFTAPHGEAYIPMWMFENLKVSDDTSLEAGQKMRFRLRTLDKAVKAKFKPMDASFAEIPTPKQVLEHSLSRITTLTAGAVVPIAHGGSTYFLKVTELKTESGGDFAGCLLDTNLEAEFEQADNFVEEEVPQLFFKNQINVILEEDDYFYCRLKLPEMYNNCNFILTSHEGHGDIYVSAVEAKPTRQIHTWYNNNAENVLELMLPGQELTGVRWLYIGVHAYGEKTRFNLTVIDKEVKEEPKGRKVGAGDDASKANDPNYEKCETCGRYIPLMSMMMHSMQCARRNWFCAICKLAIPKKDKEFHIHCDQCDMIFRSQENLKKHIGLKHALQPCPLCKDMIPADNLTYHMAEECEMRLVTCNWCGMKLAAKDLHSHEVYCSSQTTACHLCGELVPRNQFDIHLSLKHGVNPSLASGAKLIETQRLIDSLPLDADGNDLNQALMNSKLANGAGDDELAELTGEMADLLTKQQERKLEEEEVDPMFDISAAMLQDDEQKCHDFPCPFCQNMVPISEDFGDHMVACEEAM